MRIVTWTRCLHASAVAGLIGWTWSAWAQEATGTAAAAPTGVSVADLLVALGVAPTIAPTLATLGLPAVLVWYAWRTAKAGGLTVQVRIPDDQMRALVAAMRDHSLDEPPKSP